MDDSNAQVTVTPSTSEVLVLAVGGVIDTASSHAASTRLHDAVGTLPPPLLVVIDLTTVTFFAAAGVHMLTEIANACTRRGLRLNLVVDPDAIVARVLKLARLDDLPMFDTLAAALARHP